MKDVPEVDGATSSDVVEGWSVNKITQNVMGKVSCFLKSCSS